MTRPIIAGIGILGAWLGIGLGEVFAQGVSTTAVNPDPAATSAQPLRRRARLFFGAETPTIRRTAAFEEQPPVPSATVPPTPSTTVPTVPGAPVPPSVPSATLAPAPDRPGVRPVPRPRDQCQRRTSPISPCLALRKPKEAANPRRQPPPRRLLAEAVAPAVDESKLLMNALGRAGMPQKVVKVYGLDSEIAIRATLSTGERPRTDSNFGVNPNDLANRWMGNYEYYTVIGENPLSSRTTRSYYWLRLRRHASGHDLAVQPHAPEHAR